MDQMSRTVSGRHHSAFIHLHQLCAGRGTLAGKARQGVRLTLACLPGQRALLGIVVGELKVLGVKVMESSNVALNQIPLLIV